MNTKGTNHQFWRLKLIASISFLLLFSVQLKASKNHTTIIISLDGFRWDYTYIYNTPMLDFMANHGIESGLIPSFPSKTFPNHYTLATGLYPDHHGIVANSFYNPSTKTVFSIKKKEIKNNPLFYGGEPLWITAKKQGLQTAVFYWPGSEVKIQGMYPDLYFIYDKKKRLTFEERINGIIQLLRKSPADRPDLIMAYFEQPDANGHDYGPHDKRTQKAVIQMDSLVHYLYNGIEFLGLSDEVNLIVLSDHGMTWADETQALKLKYLLDESMIEEIQGSLPVNIYTKKGKARKVFQKLKDMDHVKVWMRNDIPSYLHYGENPCVGDIVIMPDQGYYIEDGKPSSGGTHGYDPTLMDMHALFRAIGPDIPHLHIPHFPNVDVYPLICELLGIEPANNDGEIPFQIIKNDK